MSSRKADQRYVGVDKDIDGGMTDTGRIIRDAWAFGLIDESETCAGWMRQGIEDLWRKVDAEWEKYGFRVSSLPDELRERYLRIQRQAVERARASGWDPELGDED
ncbi:MAG: hypothetical protein PVI91_09920 [Gammaproteobacteria bacterium]|jgi:hypothetical protein